MSYILVFIIAFVLGNITKYSITLKFKIGIGKDEEKKEVEEKDDSYDPEVVAQYLDPEVRDWIVKEYGRLGV
jgi:hypothetical protein